jgi:phenylacetate-CoA ligase
MDAWGAKVYDSYGMIELGAAGGGECSVLDGIHLSPYLITEVVDPETGENLPQGEIGEMVFTLVKREGTQLIRYRSGDMAKLMPDDVCSCRELPTDRISRILGRVDDMLFLGTGENTYPSQFEDALVGMDGVTAFQVVIDKQGYKDVLTLRLETDNRTEAFKNEVYKRLTGELSFLVHEIEHSKAVAPLEFEFLDKGTLNQESPIKVRHLVDRRE